MNQNLRSPIAMPVSTYSLENAERQMEQVRVQYRADIQHVLTDHAHALTALRREVDELRDRMNHNDEFTAWVGDTYPEVAQQFKAVKDIQEAGR